MILSRRNAMISELITAAAVDLNLGFRLHRRRNPSATKNAKCNVTLFGSPVFEELCPKNAAPHNSAKGVTDLLDE